MVSLNYFKNFCPFPFQLIPETILLLTASGTGLYYRHMTEAAHRRTFVGTRTCIESRVKLECEKEQQEQLLLSVIPAYIAAEVSIFNAPPAVYCYCYRSPFLSAA